MARRIIGSKDLTISTAMQEIIPEAPENWTVSVVLRDMSFYNSEACHIILNGKSDIDGEDNIIYLRAGQGLNIDEKDIDIHSFVIVESGIPFNFVGKC